jgi:hypothetical protein
MMRVACLACVLAVAGSAFAQEKKTEKKFAELNTVIAKRGELLFSEDFAPETWKKWNVYKGDFILENDSVKVAEKKQDNHHPAASQRLEMTDMVVQFSFKMDGSGWMGFALDDKEHIARIIIRPNSVQILKMSGIGGTTKGVKVDERRIPFIPGQWYTCTFEVVGNSMAARIGNQFVLQGRHDGLDVKKTRFELISGGRWAWFDGLRIWKAEKK